MVKVEPRDSLEVRVFDSNWMIVPGDYCYFCTFLSVTFIFSLDVGLLFITPRLPLFLLKFSVLICILTGCVFLSLKDYKIHTMSDKYLLSTQFIVYKLKI